MSISIAMVALGDGAKVAAGRVPKAWAARWPDGPQPTDGEKQDNSVAFRVGEGQVIYGLMPAPIPWTDLEGPCASAVAWPNAAEEMRQHKRHIIVTAMGVADPVERSKILTQAAIALADSCEGFVGIFWCQSLSVWPKQVFTEVACECLPDELPTPLWVSCFAARNPDESSVGFTRGLAPLGHMEFEAAIALEPPEELRERLIGLAAYILANGAVINDGDTIGESATERIKVVFGPSLFGAEGQTRQLQYRTPKSVLQRITPYGWLHAVATLACTIGIGWLLYTLVPFLKGSIFRHVLLIPITLVIGFVLLVISDRVLQIMFGLQALEDED